MVEKRRSGGLFDDLDALDDLSVEDELDAPTRIAPSSGALPRLDLNTYRKKVENLPAPEATPASPVAASAPLDALFDVEDLEEPEEEAQRLSMPTRVSDSSEVARMAAGLGGLDALPDLEDEGDLQRATEMPTRVAGTPLLEAVAAKKAASESDSDAEGDVADLAELVEPEAPSVSAPGRKALSQEQVFLGIAATVVVIAVVLFVLL